MSPGLRYCWVSSAKLAETVTLPETKHGWVSGGSSTAADWIVLPPSAALRKSLGQRISSLRLRSNSSSLALGRKPRWI